MGSARTLSIQQLQGDSGTALVYLYLGGNNIESIEGLARVQITHIKLLYLGSNNIISVRAIRKATWPALQQLGIVANYFSDAKDLVHGCFPQMHGLHVYWEEDSEENNRFIEQCFPAKMQVASLQSLNIRENNVCFDRSLKRVLQQRWPHLEID